MPECLCTIRQPGSAFSEKLKHNLNDKLFQCPYNYRNTDDVSNSGIGHGLPDYKGSPEAGDI